MSSVYLEKSLAPDHLLGHVKENGDVYRNDLGFDDRIGHVHLESGKVYARRLGKDKKIGHVDLENGKVYRSRFGPDEYVGRVEHNGDINLDRSLWPDDTVARVEPFISFAHSGAAMLLLVLPALEK